MPSTEDLALALNGSTLPIRLPRRGEGLDQDEEWFEVEHRGRPVRLRLHDYGAIFEIPRLYESLVYRALGCRSPLQVLAPLEDALAEAGSGPEDLRVLDLGAGNGIVGGLLRQMGVERIVGVDILPEAARAAERDRPGVYDDYVVTDLTRSDPDADARLRAIAPNALVTVAALGFGDIPIEAFRRAFDYLPTGGWVAMCIKDRFLAEDDDSGFGRMLRGLVADGSLGVLTNTRYVHRLSVAGEKLFYVALVARKG